MLKTISAALLAASMIAAPAAVNSTNAQTRANNTAQTPAAKTGQAQIATKVTRSKRNKLNANAKMIRHHRHKTISLHRSHPKVSFRHVATKRS